MQPVWILAVVVMRMHCMKGITNCKWAVSVPLLLAAAAPAVPPRPTAARVAPPDTPRGGAGVCVHTSCCWLPSCMAAVVQQQLACSRRFNARSLCCNPGVGAGHRSNGGECTSAHPFQPQRLCSNCPDNPTQPAAAAATKCYEAASPACGPSYRSAGLINQMHHSSTWRQA